MVFFKKAKLAQIARREREAAARDAETQRLAQNEVLAAAGLPLVAPPVAAAPTPRDSANLDLLRNHGPDRPHRRRNHEGHNPAREAAAGAPRHRQDFIANIPVELTNVIFQQAVPRGSVIVASANNDIDIEQLPAMGNGLTPIWIREALHAVQWPNWGQGLLDRGEYEISPMTMRYALNPLLPAIASHPDMRGMIYSTLGVNSNLFVFTNTYSCWNWIKEHGRTYIPLMKHIYIIFLDSQQIPQIYPPYLHDEMESVWSAGALPHWEMGTTTTDGSYLDGNFLRVSSDNIKPAAIAKALLEAGAAPNQLLFAYMTEYLPEGSNESEMVPAQLAKPLRTMYQRHDFRLAMNALRRIPTPNPLKFIYKPSVELTEADAAPGWRNFYDCLTRHHEAYEVANLTGKKVEAYLFTEDPNRFERICTAERHEPRRSRRRQGQPC